MLILPQGHDYRILLPQQRRDWRAPSAAQVKDEFGNENELAFRLDGLTHDGVVRWRGWVQDREDLDALLWAIATGTLSQQPALWPLTAPAWHPDLGEGLVYQATTLDFLTASPGSLLTYTKRGDYQDGRNAIEMVGGGGQAATNSASTAGSQGGGYSSKGQSTNLGANYAFGAGTTAQYNISKGGSRPTGAEATQGWFGAATFAGAPVNIDVAGHGGEGGANRDGGNQNMAATSTGTLKYNGGKGGDVRVGVFSNNNAAGGGGAAGPNGAGGAAAQVGTGATQSNGQGVGAAGDNGSGGAGGTVGGGAGAIGTEWNASHGSGGGGGGNNGGFGGVGGNYGGGTGGGTNDIASVSGLIVVSYRPRISGFVIPNLIF